MNRRYALWGGSAKLGVALLIAVLTGLGSQQASAQRPEFPTLSLTGAAAGWNQDYYPDGRIWIPRSGANGQRQILVPVFVKNCWRSTATHETFPIFSFKMKLQYDRSALEFVGVEKNGPNRGLQSTPLACLAKDFEFTTNIADDTTYQSVINAPEANRIRGKRVLIDAISAKPLPQTGNINDPCDQRPFVEMFYVRFNVIANPAGDPVSALTPIILTNDTLYYNDFQVGKEIPFPDDPQPSLYAGLGGVDNFYIDGNNIEQNRDVPRYSRPGMIWLQVTDEIPRLSFTNIPVSNRQQRIVDSVDNTNNAQWYVVHPITIDYGSTYEDTEGGLGTRDIDVINAVPGSRLTELLVQSDQPWLKFRSFLKGGPGEINPFAQPVREGVVPMLDKGILGTISGVTPMGDQTVLRRDLNFRIICDPNELPLSDGGEVAGIYTGYITFKSPTMDVSPVRLKVTFIYFRAPFEPNVFSDATNYDGEPQLPARGIRIEVRNSNNPIERTYLYMGVGHRATDFVDTLFGETIYSTPLDAFGARWYPMDKSGVDIYPYGLGDLWAGSPTRPQASSRDIRDIYSDTTLLYKCRFNAGSALNYPVVISWDTDDFSPSSDLFIRDTLAGSRFNVNMRTATSIGGTKYSYTIRDADINAFIIEYTLPKVITYPVINKGWNLLSLPVNPSSSYYKDIYKNALNIPIRFAQNSYQANETSLQPGVGYFIKYSDEIDRTIAGTRIRRIDDQMFPTRLYDGWNTIGALSTPVSTEVVNLIPVGASAPTIEGDIYQYVTDRGYQAVSELAPGIGYWMKIRGQAFLQIRATSQGKSGVNFSAVRDAVTSNSTQVTVRDNSNKNTNLYIAEQGTVAARNVFELPPVPPYELFDVRFSNQSYVEEAASPVINLQGVTFPMTVTVNNSARNYTVVNAVTGTVLGRINANVNNSIEITDARTPSIRLMSEDAVAGGLSVNVTPNPVTSMGLVNFTVPAAGHVTVKLYTMVGEEVATIIDEAKLAGMFSVDLNGTALVPGRYIVKLVNGNNIVTNTVTIVR